MNAHSAWNSLCGISLHLIMVEGQDSDWEAKKYC